MEPTLFLFTLPNQGRLITPSPLISKTVTAGSVLLDAMMSITCISLIVFHAFSLLSVFSEELTAQWEIHIQKSITVYENVRISKTGPRTMAIRHRSSSSDRENDSGYSSGSSAAALPEVYFTRPHLKYLNQQLSKLEPVDVLKWCMTSLPILYQTSAFGLTGLAIMDMVSQIDFPHKENIEMIFIDTLYHFPQTLDLVERVKQKYPRLKIHTFKPEGCETTQEFEEKHGELLWERDEERYDAVAKVEPAQRAYSQLHVNAVLTGRRRSQGGKRGELDILEVEEDGLIKVNPLANWSFKQVQAYIKENNVPTNDLLDLGYRSVGDWHSTKPVTDSEDERAGRWQGRQKTECGIHNKRSRYAMFLQEQEEKRQQELSDAIQNGLPVESSS